nr:hypothetical protein [Nitrosomonas nitrosa]
MRVNDEDDNQSRMNMSGEDSFSPAINRMVEEVNRLESELAEVKKTVNKLCGYAGRAALYQNIEAQRAHSGAFRRDQFFGVPLATGVKQFLEMRGDPKAGGLGAATINEIYDALISGGYDFQTKNEDNAKRALRSSVSKNTAAFVRVGGSGDAAYGLKEWYPAVRDPKGKSAADDEPAADSNQSSDAPNDDEDEGASEP